MSLSQTQELKQLTRMQQAQVQAQSLRLRMSLIMELHGEQYEPKAECPRCKRELTAVEIIAGFNQDTQDFTTCCTCCGERFSPKLVCFRDGSSIQLPFFCGVQTLAQMRGKELLSPEQFLRDAPAIYRSAIVHYGSLRSAFGEIGIQYAFEDMNDWKNKIIPFIGRLPDTVIAKHVNVSARIISGIRRKLGVLRYSARKALDEEA